MFLWGVFLVFYNEIKRHTVLKTRFGLWLLAFLALTLLTSIVHWSVNPINNGYNLVVILHLSMCFFVFYSIHTEKHLNFRRELYSVCRFIVYTTTVLGIIGLAFLLAEISFEVLWFKFIVYENRFTGLFFNPNQLGLSAVTAIFCCHMLIKKDFISISGRERVSRIWIASCISVNAISLLLCDSNGAMVLLIGYAVFFLIYKMFGSERKFSFKQIVTKSAACLAAGLIIVMSVFFIRTVTQAGFVQILKSTSDTTYTSTDPLTEQLTQDEGIVTFEHENTNIDSGRFTLWEQGLTMFTQHPVLGIGRGNVYDYGKETFENGIKFSADYKELAPFLTDFHNAYISLLVCSGVLGFAAFAVFGLRFFKNITVYVFHDDSLHESVLPCMYSYLCSYAIYSFIEVGMLYHVAFVVVFFWLILGYTSCFLVRRYEPDRTLGRFTVFGRSFRKSIL